MAIRIGLVVDHKQQGCKNFLMRIWKNVNDI